MKRTDQPTEARPPRTPPEHPVMFRFMSWFQERAIPWLVNAIAIAFVLMFLYRCVGLIL